MGGLNLQYLLAREWGWPHLHSGSFFLGLRFPVLRGRTTVSCEITDATWTSVAVKLCTKCDWPGRGFGAKCFSNKFSTQSLVKIKRKSSWLIPLAQPNSLCSWPAFCSHTRPCLMQCNYPIWTTPVAPRTTSVAPLRNLFFPRKCEIITKLTRWLPPCTTNLNDENCPKLICCVLKGIMS